MFNKFPDTICLTLSFYQCIVYLTSTEDQAMKNALLDAFAIHCRIIFDFFYPKKNIRNDDIVFSDIISDLGYYNRNKTSRSKLNHITRKTDKQVAHLTYTRNRYNSRTKPWQFIVIGKLFYKTITAFYESLPDRRKAWPHFVNLKNILDQLKETMGS